MPIHAAIALATDDEAARRHHELIAEIKALRDLGEPRQDAQRILDYYQAQIAELQKRKSELVIIHNAIMRTKQEIATLHRRLQGIHPRGAAEARGRRRAAQRPEDRG